MAGRTVLPPGTNPPSARRPAAAATATITAPTRSPAGVASVFARAADRVGLVERRYTIAGLPMTIRFAGERMLALVGRAFAHLEREATGEAGLTVHVWDSESSGVEPPPQLGEPVDVPELGPMFYYEHDGVRAMSRWQTLAVLDVPAAEAWFWTPGPGAMPSWDWAAPLRPILHWWLGAHGVVQVHGGAIGTESGGVLVVGRGGSGKSTTSLASLAAGLRYAGDDLVAITTEPEPWVHSLYCSGKLDAGHLERFPELVATIANAVRSEDEKAVVYVDDAFPDSLIAGFPLRAVVVPRVVAAQPETRALPATAAAALAALAPSTILALHPPQPNALAEMAALVRSVPCYSLELGSAVERVPEAIADLVAGR